MKKSVGHTGAPNLKSIIDKAYQKGDFFATVRTTAEYLEDFSKDHFVAPSIMGGLYKMLKDNEKQLEWMLKMYEVNDPNLPYSAIRNSNPIQDDPRYIMIMEEIGLW